MENQKTKKVTTLLLAVGLAATAVTLATGPAAAHTCAEYHGCDASGCTEGEAHDHTNYNVIGRDEHCKSEKAEEPTDPDSCEYVIRLPPVICNILEPGYVAIH